LGAQKKGTEPVNAKTEEGGKKKARKGRKAGRVEREGKQKEKGANGWEGDSVAKQSHQS